MPQPVLLRDIKLALGQYRKQKLLVAQILSSNASVRQRITEAANNIQEQVLHEVQSSMF
jgi:hypothetical protein